MTITPATTQATERDKAAALMLDVLDKVFTDAIEELQQQINEKEEDEKSSQ
ncbi:hypothetical protein QEH59_03050 [Coraliomargarita sp. SDUM461004]|uniref:Uncharacterized protein n=1 Tax=Thalassobacterium sedimentorum TaxID=3041258 RepID=A0ABU1AHX4_9BACT|nr:hypothetical protein [Coraliomargarita sp. SDUM461004]MDQ8193386.1 hypothetical protein [Coraliomargarita sp. SDUM461004]